jgi:hypothetical protein
MEEGSSIHETLSAIASEHRLPLHRDTHYDAQNARLSWWRAAVLHSVDVQSYPDGRIEVTHVRTTYPFLPRSMAWARRWIPLFPIMGRSQREHIGSLDSPCSPEQVRALIEPALPVRHPTPRVESTARS